MAAANQCPECNSSEIISENFVNVCADCGNVISDCSEAVVDKPSKYSTNIRTSVECNRVSVKNAHVETFCRDYTSAVNPRLSMSVKEGIDAIHSSCKNLNMSNNICQMAVNLFKSVAFEKHFKTGSRNVKLCLAISCVYLVSNRENNPIALAELWNSTDFVFDHFGVIFMRLEKHYPQIYPEKSKITEFLVPFYLFKLNFDRKETPIINDYATNLVWMWRAALLVQGFNPVFVIYAALYFAWKAVDLKRCKTSVVKFCSTVGIPFNPTIRERIKYYYQVLHDFYSSSPLYGGENISAVLILGKIKDMIKIKRIIIWNYNSSPLNMHAKRKEPEGGKTQVAPFNKMMKGGDRSLVDEDFSDSEIDSYIRTEDEVREITNLKLDEKDEDVISLI